MTEATEDEKKKAGVPEKTLLRKLELAGLDLRDHEWFLSDVIEDTHFKGFGHYDKRFYLYLGKIDDESEFRDHLEDLGVVLFRTEKKIRELEDSLSQAMERRDRLIARREKEEEGRESPVDRIIVPSQVALARALPAVEKEIESMKSKLDLASTMYIGFVVNPALNSEQFITEAESLIAEYERYKVSCSREGMISFGDIEIALNEPAH